MLVNARCVHRAYQLSAAPGVDGCGRTTAYSRDQPRLMVLAMKLSNGDSQN